MDHSAALTAQHGFMMGTSRLTKLLLLLYQVTKHLEEGRLVRVRYIEFDSVNQNNSDHETKALQMKGKWPPQGKDV